MPKFAAILPAITPALIGSVGLTLGSQVIDAIGRRRMMKQQEAANRAWLDFQERAKRQAQAVEDEQRGVALERLDENLGQNTQEAREEIIGTESDRLAREFESAIPTSDAVLAGAQAPGRDAVFDEAAAGSLARATQEARERMAALATAMSYGGGTTGSMGAVLGREGQRAGQDIGFTNLIRNDATDLLRRQQQRSPQMFEYDQSPLVPLLAAGGQIVGGLGGDFWGRDLFGGPPRATPRPMPRPFRPSALPPRETLQFSFVPPMNTPGATGNIGWGWT